MRKRSRRQTSPSSRAVFYRCPFFYAYISTAPKIRPNLFTLPSTPHGPLALASRRVVEAPAGRWRGGQPIRCWQHNLNLVGPSKQKGLHFLFVAAAPLDYLCLLIQDPLDNALGAQTRQEKVKEGEGTERYVPSSSLTFPFRVALFNSQ